MELGRQQLAFALDVDTLELAREWVDRLKNEVGVFKVGLELFVRFGPAAVKVVTDQHAQCFLDLKLHDIPETVGRSVRSACDLGVNYLTLHASGGRAMLERAASETASASTKMQLLAVTVLTSLDDQALEQIGFAAPSTASVARLARLATDCGVTGLVCSAHEVASLRKAHPNACLVTPGIRPIGAATGDQLRVATAKSAIESGSTLLVVGRPIRDASDPVAAARAIVAEIQAARM
jgi:orotidine-5'-phosphate decarboxylase